MITQGPRNPYHEILGDLKIIEEHYSSNFFTNSSIFLKIY